MEVPSAKFWFPASRRGWGWDFPVTWQGWLVLASYFGLATVGFLNFKERSGARSVYFAVLMATALAIFLLKGERRSK